MKKLIIMYVAVNAFSACTVEDVSQIRQADIVGQPAPPGTRPPMSSCVAPLQASPIANRSIMCPFQTTATAKGEYSKACEQEGDKWVANCSGTCTLQTGELVLNHETHPAYCTPGGPAADPYYSGCDNVQGPPQNTNDQTIKKNDGIKYANMELCEAALANFECGTLAAGCKEHQDMSPPTYVEGRMGQCCEMGGGGQLPPPSDHLMTTGATVLVE